MDDKTILNCMHCQTPFYLRDEDKHNDYKAVCLPCKNPARCKWQGCRDKTMFYGYCKGHYEFIAK